MTTIVSHHTHHSSLAVDYTVTALTSNSTEVVLTTLKSHCQSDGSTERAHGTITETLHQRIHPAELPEFAINSLKPECGNHYALFFLNAGCRPSITSGTSASATEYPSVCEFVLRKRITTHRSAHDSVMAVHAKLDQTRDTNQKQQVIPLKYGDIVCLSRVMKFHTTIILVPAESRSPGPFTGNSTHLRSHINRGFHDIFHASLLHIHATSDDLSSIGHVNQRNLNNTNDSAEGRSGSLTVHPIRIIARSNTNVDALFNIKWNSDSNVLVIHHIVQFKLSSYARTSENDLKSFTCAVFILVTSTCPTSPALFSILSPYLLTIYDSFISPFLCPFRLSFISPTVDLEYCHYPHQSYLTVDSSVGGHVHQLYISIRPTHVEQLQPLVKCPGYNFNTPALISPIRNHTTVHEYLGVSTSAGLRLGLNRSTIQDSDIIGNLKITETNYSANVFISFINHHPNSFGHSLTTGTIDEHSTIEIATQKSDTHPDCTTENDVNHPIIRSAPQKNDVNHSHQSFNVSMSSNFAFPVYSSVDAISVQEDQLHTSVHLIWRAYVRIRYLFSPIFGYYHHHICLIA